jgi:hypothetical protein
MIVIMPMARSDFGYLVGYDGCCHDAGDFLLEVIRGEMYKTSGGADVPNPGLQSGRLRSISGKN